MKIETVVKLACECIDREIQRLAVDGNLYKLCGMQWGKAAHERREALREARAALVHMAEQPRQMDLFGIGEK